MICAAQTDRHSLTLSSFILASQQGGQVLHSYWLDPKDHFVSLLPNLFSRDLKALNSHLSPVRKGSPRSQVEKQYMQVMKRLTLLLSLSVPLCLFDSDQFDHYLLNPELCLLRLSQHAKGAICQCLWSWEGRLHFYCWVQQRAPTQGRGLF